MARQAYAKLVHIDDDDDNKCGVDDAFCLCHNPSIIIVYLMPAYSVSNRPNDVHVHDTRCKYDLRIDTVTVSLLLVW